MNKKEQKEKIIELAGLIRDTGKLYSECLLDPKNVEKKIGKISEKETLGDALQNELSDHFSQEKNIPYLAIDRVKLIGKMDDILDQILLSIKIFKIYGSELSDDFPSEIEPLAKNCETITTSLSLAVEEIYTNFENTRLKIKEIEEQRDKASDTSFKLERKAFELADPSKGWKVFESTQRILGITMKIIARTKAASEILEIMVLKYD